MNYLGSQCFREEIVSWLGLLRLGILKNKDLGILVSAIVFQKVHLFFLFTRTH